MDLGSFAISTRWANALLLPAAIVASAPTLQAQEQEDESYMGENPEQYASIRVLEGEANIRKGDVDEPLSRGIPVAEGDVVESHGRGILQLADGTRVAFGPGTRFRVAALFRGDDEERQVLLRLDQGRLRVSLGRESDAMIRIDMPSGSARMSDGSGASFEVEREGTTRMKVHTGEVDFSNERDRTSIEAGERLTVYSDQDRLDRIRSFNTQQTDAFDDWSERNLVVRRGPSWDKVPPELRYQSSDLDENGEWVYVDEYRSWCWRPLRVSAEWRPYWRGRWGAFPGGMTWISEEPWGYLTYHHGRWGWGARLGWYWIPGVYYSPAWVAWQTSDVYFGWAPMGYYNHPVIWGYGPWQGGYCWNIVQIDIIHAPHLHIHMHHHPNVIHHFDRPSSRGDRPLTPPWHRGPVMVSRDELRNPSRIRQVLDNPRVGRSRLQVYEQQSGRPIYRRPLSRSYSAQTNAPQGFEDRSPLRTPVVRSGDGARPLHSRPVPGNPVVSTETRPPKERPGTDSVAPPPLVNRRRPLQVVPQEVHPPQGRPEPAPPLPTVRQRPVPPTFQGERTPHTQPETQPAVPPPPPPPLRRPLRRP